MHLQGLTQLKFPTDEAVLKELHTKMLATANAVARSLAAGSSDELSTGLSSLRGCAQTRPEHRECWQALCLLWPHYTQVAANMVKHEKGSTPVPHTLWWTIHHTVQEMAQHCQETEDVILVLSQLGLHAAQVCSSGSLLMQSPILFWLSWTALDQSTLQPAVFLERQASLQCGCVPL